MSWNQQVFSLDSEDVFRGLVGLLRRDYKVHEQGLITRKSIYLDTFDQRLWRNKAIVEYQVQGRKKVLLCRQLNHGQVISETPVEKQPEFMTDFPQWLRPVELQKIIKVRKLLYQVGSISRVYIVDVLNRKSRKVVSLEMIQEKALYRNHREGKNIPIRLNIRCSKGEEKHCDSVLQKVRHLGLKPTRDDAWLQLMGLAGKTPNDYRSKVHLTFPKNIKAGVAYQRILMQLLQTMQMNEQGICSDIDTEFLHDFRVSVRRTRSLLANAKAIFPAKTLQDMAGEFSWLGGITSPLRDDDVWLLSFDHYQKFLPEEMQVDLEPLRRWLQKGRVKSLEEVVRALGSERYKILLNDWKRFLQSDLSEQDGVRDSQRLLIKVSRKKIWKTYLKLRQRGELINDTSPPQMLHDLRKTGKKLRYLLEFFQSLFPGEDIKVAIKKLERLQGYLGTYQDYEVQRQSLQVFMTGMKESGELPAESADAIEHLIRDMADREYQHRQGFSRYFTAFEHPEIHQLYQRQFN